MPSDQQLNSDQQLEIILTKCSCQIISEVNDDIYWFQVEGFLVILTLNSENITLVFFLQMWCSIVFFQFALPNVISYNHNIPAIL